MRKEFDKSTIDLIEALPDGEWAVRWDMKPKLDESGNETGIYWYEEEIFNHIPEIDEIKSTITNWHNKQIDGQILRGCLWNNMPIWLSMENQFNYKSIFDLAMMTEPQVQAWDSEHPDMAGINYTFKTVPNEETGELIEVIIPTGRPRTVFPVQFKFGTDKNPQYYTFNDLNELSDFYNNVLQYIQNCYTAGWYKKDTFDYSVYEKLLNAM